MLHQSRRFQAVVRPTVFPLDFLPFSGSTVPTISAVPRYSWWEEGRGQGEQCKAGERPGIALDQKSVPVAVKSGDIHLLLCQCIVGYSEREILKMFWAILASFDQKVTFKTNVYWSLLLRHVSRVRLCATPKTAAHQAPPSLGFSRQEHWSGLPFPCPMHESEKRKWPTVRNPMDCSLLGSPVHGILQARVLERGAIAFSVLSTEVNQRKCINPVLPQQNTFSLFETPPKSNNLVVSNA